MYCSIAVRCQYTCTVAQWSVLVLYRALLSDFSRSSDSNGLQHEFAEERRVFATSPHSVPRLICILTCWLLRFQRTLWDGDRVETYCAPPPNPNPPVGHIVKHDRHPTRYAGNVIANM